MIKDYIDYNNNLFAKYAPSYDRIEILLGLVRSKIVKLVGQRPQKILDVACGTGTLAVELARIGHEVVGFDLSPDMLSVAKSKLKPSLQCSFEIADVSNLDIPDNSFDVSVSSFTFHDMPEEIAKQTIRELARVTKPEDKIILVDYRKPKNFLLAWGVSHVPLFWESIYFSNFISKGLHSFIDSSTLSVEQRYITLFGFVEILVCKKIE